ncbi:hypothetical protein FKM82_026920 [Ascaphus truei]
MTRWQKWSLIKPCERSVGEQSCIMLLFSDVNITLYSSTWRREKPHYHCSRSGLLLASHRGAKPPPPPPRNILGFLPNL